MHFAPGSALTLAPRLSVAVRGLPQKSVGIEAGRQKFGGVALLRRLTLHRRSWSNKKTNLILCLEKVTVVAIETSAQTSA